MGIPVSGVQIGHEELSASDWFNPKVEDRYVHVIARKYRHLQQARALVKGQELQRTRGILAEGATEFTSELISIEVAYSYLSALCRRCEATQPTPRIHLAQCFGHGLGLMPEIKLGSIKRRLGDLSLTSATYAADAVDCSSTGEFTRGRAKFGAI